MEEFLKLKWDISEPSELENQNCCFIPEEQISESYVYKHLAKALITKTKTLKGLNNKIDFVPGHKYVPKFFKPSLLDQRQQETCLLALRILQSGKHLQNQLTNTESLNVQMYKKLKQKISDENKRYLDYTRTLWERRKLEIAKLKNNVFRYAESNFHNKFKRYLTMKEHYHLIDQISMFYEEGEDSVEVKQMCNLLEVGTLARFSQPSFKFNCTLHAKTLPAAHVEVTNSKLPVSQDENIKKLIDINNIDVVISSSGLKIIFGTDFKNKWMLPVTVESTKIDKEENKKVIFIDKPLASTNPDPLDLKYHTMKRLVKCNFCQYEAFKFPNEDESRISEFKKKLNEFEANLNKQNADEKQENTEDSTTKCNPVIENKIHHNVSYRLWKVKKTINQNTLLKHSAKNTELNMLVRCKLDACESTESGSLQPVILVPKIELQLEYGASIPTKSELLREWTSLYFRPFSNLYRARLHWSTGEVVSMEKCTSKKVESEIALHYEYNPYLGLGVLEKLLNRLMDLEMGSYLLLHKPEQESFVNILKECDDSVQGAFNLHAEFEKCLIEDEIKQSWVPIDTNYILPIHEANKRMPGLFKGLDDAAKKMHMRKNAKKKKGLALAKKK